MAAVLNRPGAWQRGGMDGGLCGLDWPAALASVPAGLDRERAKRLLTIAEARFVVAWWERDERDNPKRKA